MIPRDQRLIAAVILAAAILFFLFSFMPNGGTVDSVLDTGAETNEGVKQEAAGNGHLINVSAGDRSPVTIYLNSREEIEKEEEEEKESVASLVPAPKEFVVPIIEHEEYRETPYELNGVTHVCYGHKLTDNAAVKEKYTPEECVQLLINDITWAIQAALQFSGADSWSQLGVRRQGVIVELAYMVGEAKLADFDLLQKKLQTKDWKGAGIELEDSRLPKQVGPARISDMMTRLL